MASLSSALKETDKAGLYSSKGGEASAGGGQGPGGPQGSRDKRRRDQGTSCCGAENQTQLQMVGKK